MVTETSQEVAKIENAAPVFDNNMLANMTDFASIEAMFKGADVSTDSFSDYGTGFKILSNKDKDKLIGVKLIVVEWRFNEGDYDGGFVSAYVMTEDKKKFILNDGSTGIRDQLRMVTEQRVAKGHPHPQAALYVEGGLRRSDYTKVIDGKESAASTFYLAE